MDATEERCERRVGTTFRDKWTLERLVGVGGMAAVYVGRHKIGRRDAIKILHPDIAEDEQLVARFEQEAHAVNRFKHPGAVEILDVDVSDPREPFLVMELLEGESVDARLAKGSLGVDETLRIIDELLDVLVAAHAAGIVHRDIKPDNLFLVEDARSEGASPPSSHEPSRGRVKVLDFGIARFVKGSRKSVQTAVGVTIGTLAYMPPEQVAGKEIDHRADIFAVGCTMFRMLAGRTPHVGETDLELMVKVGMEPAPPFASVAPNVPRAVCAIVDRALAFDRDRRYPGARTMQSDVRAVREGREPPYAMERLLAGDAPNVARDELGPIARALADRSPSSGEKARAPVEVPSATDETDRVPAVQSKGDAPIEERPRSSFALATAVMALLLGVAIAALWASRAPSTPPLTQVLPPSAPASATEPAPSPSPSAPAASALVAPDPDPTEPVVNVTPPATAPAPSSAPVPTSAPTPTHEAQHHAKKPQAGKGHFKHH